MYMFIYIPKEGVESQYLRSLVVKERWQAVGPGRRGRGYISTWKNMCVLSLFHIGLDEGAGC